VSSLHVQRLRLRLGPEVSLGLHRSLKLVMSDPLLLFVDR
jgi:hypothetical protein